MYTAGCVCKQRCQDTIETHPLILMVDLLKITKGVGRRMDKGNMVRRHSRMRFSVEMNEVFVICRRMSRGVGRCGKPDTERQGMQVFFHPSCVEIGMIINGKNR